MSSTRHRALRSDAAANRDRLLAAATVAVKHDGENVPMATVAARAGVGVGTHALPALPRPGPFREPGCHPATMCPNEHGPSASGRY